MAATSGYPLEWFVEELDDKFKCGICFKVLKDPTATSCGHVYCGRCILTWVNYYGVCPRRCSELEVDALQPTRHLADLISGLAVQCKNKSSGCRVQPRLVEKHAHEQSCPYRSPSAGSRAGLRKLLKTSVSQLDLTREFRTPHHKRTRSSATIVTAATITGPGKAVAKRSPSSAAALCRTSSALSKTAGTRAMPAVMVRRSALASQLALLRFLHGFRNHKLLMLSISFGLLWHLHSLRQMIVHLQNTKGTYSIHTFRLKRTRAKEPLGLVLVSGEKVSYHLGNSRARLLVHHHHCASPSLWFPWWLLWFGYDIEIWYSITDT